jgi:hypothetical protein
MAAVVVVLTSPAASGANEAIDRAMVAFVTTAG